MITLLVNFEVLINKRSNKQLRKLPQKVQDKFWVLVGDLERSGPCQPGWPNYSPLGENEYHCHLGYSWVACWKHEKGSVQIYVYYVGSREGAPY